MRWVRRVRAALAPARSEAERAVVRGTGIATTARVITEGIRALRLLLMAKMLAPEDVGTFGVAMAVLSFLDMVTEPGIQVALVRRPGDIEHHLETAFSLQLLRGALLAAALYLLAPAIAGFFNIASAVIVVRALAAVVMLRALTNPAIARVQRELRFLPMALMNLADPVVSVIVLVPLLLMRPDAWALMLAFIAGQAARTVVSYVICPYRPRLAINLAHARELASFGRWMVSAQVVIYLCLTGDNLFVGRTMGPAALGFYALAFRITELPSTLLTRGMSDSILPVFSKLQHDRAALSQFFGKAVLWVSCAAFAISAVIIAGAPLIQKVFLSERWDGIVPVMRILALGAMLRAVLSVAGALSVAVGRPDINFHMNATRLVVMAATIYPLAHRFGLIGVGISVALGLVAHLLVCIVTARQFLAAAPVAATTVASSDTVRA